MHILIIPSWYKTKANPVTGSFFEEQARGLQKKGHKVGVFFPEFSSFSSGDKFIYKEYNDNGLPTIRIRIKALIPRNHPFNYWYFCIRAYNYVKNYIDAHGEPDIIHAHTVFFGGIVARYINKRTGIPFILTEHYTPFITGGITHPYKIKLAKKVFRSAEQAIVVSSSFRELLSKKLNLSPDLFEVVHNMVAPAFFEANCKLDIRSDNPVVFFTTSFLTERKNHKLMIDAFQIFNNQYKNKAIFKIGGDGPLREELEAYVKQKGMEDSIIFQGLLSREEVKKELDRSHIFLLASKFETFGVVLIEALAAGKPIITTDSRGPRDIVTKENGMMVASWESVAYAEKMIQMVENYKNYNFKRISEDCINRFSEETIITKLENVYKAIV